mgnify:CR=1 FL=1
MWFLFPSPYKIIQTRRNFSLDDWISKVRVLPRSLEKRQPPKGRWVHPTPNKKEFFKGNTKIQLNKAVNTKNHLKHVGVFYWILRIIIGPSTLSLSLSLRNWTCTSTWKSRNNLLVTPSLSLFVSLCVCKAALHVIEEKQGWGGAAM